MKFWPLVLCFVAAACATEPPPPAVSTAPRFSDETLIARDGAALGVKVWRAEETRAVIIALHGMNDYGHAFALPGEWWAANAGITTYALDQRGFGRSPMFGRWPGREALQADLIAAIAAARAAHPGLPVYIVGHSMGAAVVMSAAERRMLDVDGVVLAAPGVWGGARLPIFYRMALDIAVTFAPGKTLTGERADRQSTDNIEILRAMFRDPLVIKETRIDAIKGVVGVMGEAWSASERIGGDILFLYGEKDEIIPVEAMEDTASRLCGRIDVRRYAEGWHLLFRDLQAERVWRDVAEWIAEDIEAKDAAGPHLRFGPAASVCAGASEEVGAAAAKAFRPAKVRGNAAGR